jgi:hypothetical protein
MTNFRKNPVPWRFRPAVQRLLVDLYSLRGPEFQSIVRPRTSESLSFMLAGDVSMMNLNLTSPEEAFGSFHEVWKGCDLRIANLESVLTRRTKRMGQNGSFLRADPECVRFLQEAQFDCLAVANNHALDFGPEAMSESVQHLLDSGISTCGATENGTGNSSVARIERRGVKIAVVAYCDEARIPPPDRTGLFPAKLNPDTVEETIRTLRSEADIVAVNLHWGYEFALHPFWRHVEQARRFAKAGAQLIMCHHAHVPMGLEVFGDSLICYGLGNFLFSTGNYQRKNHHWTSLSVGVRADIGRTGVHRVELHPFERSYSQHFTALKGIRRNLFSRGMGTICSRLADEQWLRRGEHTRIMTEAVRRLRGLRITNHARARELIVNHNNPKYTDDLISVLMVIR